MIHFSAIFPIFLQSLSVFSELTVMADVLHFGVTYTVRRAVGSCDPTSYTLYTLYACKLYIVYVVYAVGIQDLHCI